MVKMYSNGITIFVQPGEVSFYKRAGYVVVEDPKPESPKDEPPADKDSKPNKK